MKALTTLGQMLIPTYQSMIRESKSVYEAWEMLRDFFVKQTLHYRVQLRKELNAFALGQGEDLITHTVHFSVLCSRLAAVGEAISEDERLVILFGSLPQEYDYMAHIIEAHGKITLLDANEMASRVWPKIEVRRERASS